MILQKPVVLEVGCKAVNSTVMQHMVLSVAIHLLFHFTMYCLYPPLPFLAQITVIDGIVQNMGKRRWCPAAHDLPAVLLDLHSLSICARQFFGHYIANSRRWIMWNYKWTNLKWFFISPYLSVLLLRRWPEICYFKPRFLETFTSVN